MSGRVRAFAVAAVVAIATLGEGGAAASGLLAVHLLLAAAVVACVLLLPATASAPSRIPSTAWLAFVVMACLSAAVAPYAYAAWLVLVELLAFSTVVWLASGAPHAVAGLLTPVLALLAFAHGAMALAEKLSGTSRPASTFLNPNHLAAWLAASALFLVSGLFAEPRSLAARLRDGAGVVMALAGVFVTGSRGAMLGLAVGAAALVALSWRVLSGRARRALLASAAIVVLTAVFGATNRFRTDDDPYRFHRTRIWAASLRAAAGAPWLGVGPGQFAAAAPNINFALPDAKLNYGRTFHTPHSDVLRAVCEFGFPGGLAALGAAALAGWEAVRRRAGLSGFERAAIAALCALAAQATVDDLTSRPALTMLGAACFGLVVARERDGWVRPHARVTAMSAAFLVVCALGLGEVSGFVAWNELRGLPRGRLDAGQLERLWRSLSWNPMQPAAWQRLAEHFVGDGRSWQPADYAAAREAAEHARRLQPADAYYARAEARVEATACLTLFPFQSNRERASRLYGEATRLARTDATIPLEEARFLMRAGDPAGARRAASRALAIEPKAAAPRLGLAQAILRDEGARGAVEARRLLDEAVANASGGGESLPSAYDALMRTIDPGEVEALRRELDDAASPGTAP